MYKQLITSLKTSLKTLSLAMVFISVSHAKEDTFQENININSSRQAVDLKNKIASYIDNVVITQGTLTIKADLVQVMETGNNEEKTYLAKGNPATFEHQLENGKPIYLQANEIKYQPSQNILTVTGNAELRGEGMQSKGGTIRYNFLTEQVCTNCTESDKNERVSTVLQPNKLEKDK